MDSNKTTFVTLVLDETGSMEPIRDDTIGGFNQYLDQLKQSEDPILFTLIKFDSNRHEMPYRAVPVGEVAGLTRETYQPGAATPLIDAAFKAIKATEAKVAEMADANVGIVIQTDGHENASTEHTSEELVALIKEKTAAGWLFTFLGAGIDAFDQASQLGISPDVTLTYGRTASPQAFMAAGQSMARYCSTGLTAAAAFTPTERSSSAGELGTEMVVPPDNHRSTSAARPKSKSVVEDIEI